MRLIKGYYLAGGTNGNGLLRVYPHKESREALTNYCETVAEQHIKYQIYGLIQVRELRELRI